VSPDFYAEAYSTAADYLGNLPFVDRNRIGVIGICGSGAFALSAAKIDPRLKAIATVSMYDHGTLYRKERPSGVAHRRTGRLGDALLGRTGEERLELLRRLRAAR
jgi:dienelactone hydrolase